jgi:predicted transposase YbfD/YdcC
MPAGSSSPINPAIGQLLAVTQPLADDPSDDRSAVLSVLALISDPRKRRGVRHRLPAVLGLAVCAVLAGARSFVAIAEWAADADDRTLAELGVTSRVPCESTIRRTLQNLDADALDDKVGAWAQARTIPPPSGRRRVAVDGKTLRGSGGAGEPGRHLLAAFDHAHGVVLGQVDVEAKTNEIPMFATLLDRIDLTGAVVTADAMHAQRAHAEYLADQRRAHYVLTVKGNQPSLHAQLKALPWREIPVADNTRERGHGRLEWRTMKVTAVAAGLGFPHAAQVIQIVRRRRPLGGRNRKKWSSETVYAITSLTATQASPTELAHILRGHWTIEDRLHWVRDVVYDEDRSQIRTGNGPRVMASLRNLAITILRLTGTTNIAAALRHHARRAHRPLQTIMRC